VAPALASAPGTIPDVRGLSAREAARVLAAAGVQVRLSGSGVVSRQQPAAGTVIGLNQTCELFLVRAVAQADPERGLEP
jgi:beta-lactam-binding protein with PASTA domain